MRRLITLAAACGIAAVATLAVPGAAQAAPSSQDTTFLSGNERTNLAEITLASLGAQKGTVQQTAELASMTKMDHTAAKAKVIALGAKLKVTLPSAPSAAQQQQALKLKNASSTQFDLMYAQVQVAGHKLSISATEQEISTGTDPEVIAYAKYYLPVAQKHLAMAQDEVSTLGGNPSAVPAGSGGAAASSTSTGSNWWQVGLLSGVLLIAAAAVPSLRRRRISQV